jgi:nitrogen regulatory protein PII
VVVSPDEADAVFDYICARAQIGRPGGGMVLMDRLLGATPYVLSAGLSDEADD